MICLSRNKTGGYVIPIEKVDIDNQGWTYSSYVKAGDFIYTSVCSGSGDTVNAAIRQETRSLLMNFSVSR